MDAEGGVKVVLCETRRRGESSVSAVASAEPTDGVLDGMVSSQIVDPGHFEGLFDGGGISTTSLQWGEQENKS